MKTYSFIKNLVFIIISLAAGLIFTYFVYYSSNSDATKQYTTNLSSNWTINSNTSFIDLPISVPLAIGDTLTLSTIIPDDISSEYNTLCLPTYYFNVEVFLNETLIYQNEPKFAPLLSTNGTDLILIPLQDSFHNQMLTIKIVPQLNITKYKIDSPFLCNKGDYFDYAYYQDIFNKIVLYSILFLGITLLFIGIYLRNRVHNDYSFINLSIFAIIVSIYLSTQHTWSKLLFPNSTIIYLCEFISHLILLLPVLLLFQKALIGLGKKISFFTLSLSVINAALQLFLFIFTKIEFRELLIITHIIMLISILCNIGLLLVPNYIKEDIRNELIFSFIPAGLLGVIDIIYHYFTQKSNPTNFLYYGLAFFILSQAFFITRRYTRLFEQTEQNKIYQKLAFFDLLTQLKNRNAYEREFQELAPLDAPSIQSYSCITLDVNELKKTNDTYGHSVGDQMLKTISEHLTQFFPKALGIYRLGGDEFLVLANSYTREELDIRLNYLIQYSHANPYYKDLVYSFSYGIAFYDSSTMSGVADLVAKADELMYQMKRKNKASQ